ncbi:MAG TPA: sulfotransferase [Solirubrobacteraceae bacterium]|nr:sulfotransferase [Solirubrobacteraceae bacterium]
MAQRPNEDQLTWIFGSSRSGSTWLERMLSEFSEELQAIDETGIGHHLGVWRPIPLAWATCDDPPDLSTFAAVKESNPDYFFSEEHRAGWEPLLRSFILDRLALQHDGRRMVIKEPGGSQVADWIMALLPGSRLVFLLRDGRDVVDSWLDAYSDGGWITDDGGFPVAEHGRIPFIRWQATVWRYRTEVTQRAYDAHAADRRVLVRYEELLAEPERELGRVLETIGVRAAPDRLRAAAEKHAYTNVPVADRGAGKFVRAAAPGSWRERMSEEEQQALLEVLGDTCRSYGYRTG